MQWHDEARALKREHPDWTYRRLAKHFGVSVGAVFKALNPERSRTYNDRAIARRRIA